MSKLNVKIFKRYFKHLWIWMLRNDVFIFLVFVAIATLFWWGRAMSSPRETTISLPITYTDIPSQVVFTQSLPSHIDVTLRDNGKLLRYIKHTSPSIVIDLADRLNDEEGVLILSSDVLRPKIQDILPGSTIIQQIRPESIEAAYQHQNSKVVPIQLQASWTLKNQYQLSCPPAVTPAEIEIYGAQNDIEAIDYILTDSIVFYALNDTLQKKIPLRIPRNIRSNIQDVEVTFIAEQFTDKSFTIPIRIENAPKNEIIHLFPQEVTITVRVGISNFANVKSEQFQAVCQYPTQPVSTLPIKIMHNNSYITQMRTSIRDVEYIIER